MYGVNCLAQCTNCLLDLDQYRLLEGGFCPNCGRKQFGAATSGPRVDATDQASEVPSNVAPVGPGASFALLERFWNTLRDVILRPAQFFNQQASALVSDEGLSSALAFAVIVQWLASFFNFVWRSTVGVVMQNRFDDLFRIASDVVVTAPGTHQTLDQFRQNVIDFLFGAGAIVLTPFTTLIKLAVTALFVHAAVRFFTKEAEGRPHSYSTTLKILSYSTAPWILCVIPGFGVLLAWILGFIVAVIGIREVYRTTTGRAVVAVAFPELLFLTLLFGVGVVVLFLAFNVLRLVF